MHFFDWIGRIGRGDLDTPVVTGLPLTTLIAERTEPTLSLMALPLVIVIFIVIAVTIAIPLGVLAAWQAGTWIDRTEMAFAVIEFSIPVFAVGYVLAYVFALELDWFPVHGYTPLRAASGHGWSTSSYQPSHSVWSTSRSMHG